MTDRRAIRERLEHAPVPGEREAEERAWEVVRAAYADRSPAPATARYGRFAAALASAAALAALVLSPAGADVRDWISDTIDPGVKNAEPALTSLPAPGRLLVESARGPWIVNEDGSKRLLGDYEQATWSPQGLFAAVTAGRELTAVVADPEYAGQPIGTPRWSVTQARPVSDPAWAPSGFRVAYLSGSALHVIVGDGTDDRVIDPSVSRVAPAWRPQAPADLRAHPDGVGTHRLAYVDADGTVRIVDVDSGRLISNSTGSARADPGAELLWAPDGRRLVVLSRHGISGLEPAANTTFSIDFPGTPVHTAGAFVPDTEALAVANLYDGDGRVRSEVTLWRFGDDPVPAREGVFAGRGRVTEITPSPDGRWLLLASRDADQWIFIRIADGKLKPIDAIASQFDPGGSGPAPFPGVAGWCCTG